MKHLLITIIAIISFTTLYSQNKDQLNILDNFIITHNDGSDDAIKQFIKDSYLPEIYATINLNDHIAFYKELINEFGDLNNQIYYLVEENPYKLVVHLIKKDQNINNLVIDPGGILQVEIDLSKTNPKYMKKGLGLGALLYDQKRG
jgi:hypothetical protein